MRTLLLSLVAVAMPVAASAQTTTPTIVNRNTVTTITPGAAANFSAASYVYANTIKFDATAGTYPATVTIQPNATGIYFTGTGTTVVTPPTFANGTTSADISAVSPGGAGQGFTFGYNGNATGFLTPSIIGGRYALTFSGGGTNLVDTGGTFDSTVRILGDWSAAASHTAATYDPSYTVLSNFVFASGFTTFSVETTNFQGASPTISFSLLGSTAAVPEPATWTMLILGFGLVGWSLRRRSERAFDAKIRGLWAEAEAA